MAVSVETNSIFSNQEDKMNLDSRISEEEDDANICSFVIDLVREGHFSFVYDCFPLNENETSKSAEKGERSDNYKYQTLKSDSKEPDQMCSSMKKCFVKLKKLPDDFVQRQNNDNKTKDCFVNLCKLSNKKLVKDCYVNVCKLPNFEKTVFLLGNFNETDDDIKEIETLYFLTKDDLWKCKICELEVKCKDDIVEHLNVHSVLKPFKCRLCSSNFKAK